MDTPFSFLGMFTHASPFIHSSLHSRSRSIQGGISPLRARSPPWEISPLAFPRHTFLHSQPLIHYTILSKTETAQLTLLNKYSEFYPTYSVGTIRAALSLRYLRRAQYLIRFYICALPTTLLSLHVRRTCVSCSMFACRSLMTLASIRLQDFNSKTHSPKTYP